MPSPDGFARFGLHNLILTEGENQFAMRRDHGVLSTDGVALFGLHICVLPEGESQFFMRRARLLFYIVAIAGN